VTRERFPVATIRADGVASGYRIARKRLRRIKRILVFIRQCNRANRVRFVSATKHPFITRSFEATRHFAAGPDTEIFWMGPQDVFRVGTSFICLKNRGKSKVKWPGAWL
jgi:hypothetical protein